MTNQGHNIVVLGASAGGLDAVDEVMGRIPPDIPASFFIVQHMAPQDTGAALLSQLSKHNKLVCKLAIDGEEFTAGTVYIAPPDHHLLVTEKTLLVTKGARENRYRPAIDPMFRSAAVTHGASVIGVVLTGMLDDGTAGLTAIKRCGGITVVQNPKNAAYPEMPQSALNNVDVDHCVELSEMSGLLERLIRSAPGKKDCIPKDIQIEAVIAERILSDVAEVNALGVQVPYNCPNCGGVLWKIDATDLRYRCHTGHSFTAACLLTSQSEKIEETLWVSLRMFEEHKNLLNNMAEAESRARAKASYKQREKDIQIHIERIRAMLLSSEGGKDK